MAQVYGGEESKKIKPLTVPKILEQLERALMDIKYSHPNTKDDEMLFNSIDDAPIKSKTQLPEQFIGKELMLFEMIGILNGKIAELQKKYDKIKGIEEREAHFMSSQANEITNPLQKIFDYAKLAKSGQIDQNDAWEGVLDVAQKLQNVTTVVLDSNRIDNDSLKLVPKHEWINELISEVVRTAKSNKSKVPIHVGLDNDIEIPADKARLRQVLQTIINNAIKYTEKGYIKVESFVAHEQNVVIIRINDTGKGIPQKILPKLFEKDVTKTIEAEKASDTKLSLYLCKGIIKAHGGNITAKNNKDVGSTFTITLPIKKN